MTSASLLSGHFPVFFDILQFTVQLCDPAFDQAAIHLQFLLSRSSGSNSASQSGHRSSPAGQSGLLILKLRQFYLYLTFTGRCPCRKDIQNDQVLSITFTSSSSCRFFICAGDNSSSHTIPVARNSQIIFFNSSIFPFPT